MTCWPSKPIYFIYANNKIFFFMKISIPIPLTNYAIQGYELGKVFRNAKPASPGFDSLNFA